MKWIKKKTDLRFLLPCFHDIKGKVFYKIIIGDVKDLIWQSQMMEIINPGERFM